MISKNRLKELAAFRQQKVCDEHQVFVVEGGKMVEEALRENVEILVICCLPVWAGDHRDLLDSREWYEVSQPELERLSAQKCPNQVWALCSRGSLRPITGGTGMVLALDHLQDPGNMGTIIRTADWFGIRKIVCSHDTVSCFNPKVVQATMGGIFRTEVVYTDLPEWLRNCGRPIYGALLDGCDLRECNSDQDSVLVIGNESKGISPEVKVLVDHKVLIPNFGKTAESLNAAIASGILMAWFRMR